MEDHRLAGRAKRGSRSVMKQDKKMPVAHDEGKNLQHPARQQIKFRWLAGAYAIVRMDAESTVPEWATKGVFSSVTRTADELSIVCPADNLPAKPKLRMPLDLLQARRAIPVLANWSVALFHRAALQQRHSNLRHFDLRHRLRAGARTVYGRSSASSRQRRPRPDLRR